MSEYSERVIRDCDLTKSIIALEDGFYYYWVNSRGAYSANDLRIIADELDKRNEPAEQNIKETK